MSEYTGTNRRELCLYPSRRPHAAPGRADDNWLSRILSKAKWTD